MLTKWSGDMLYRKLWRTMGLYKAQFISMIIMIALGVGVFVGFNMEWVSIEQNTGKFFEKTGLQTIAWSRRKASPEKKRRMLTS